MRRPRALAGALFLSASLALAAEPPAAPQQARALPVGFQSWTGDLDGMIQRRVIRVLVPYSRSLYFIDKGHERGITADFVRDFERYLNEKYAKRLGNRPITIVIAPVTRDQLFRNVADGIGDIAAGNLTVTEERLEIVDFVASADQPKVSELVLTGPGSPAIKSVDDLAGKTVYTRKSSSYYESLVALNQRFEKEGKPAIDIVFVPDALEDEDMMELLNVGILGVIVVDSWKASMWAQVLPKITVNEGARVRTSGRIGWAIRKDSPGLQASLEAFYSQYIKKQDLATTRLAKYHRSIRQIRNPGQSGDWKRFQDTMGLFYRYGAKYGFDPLMLAAQGFQESRLDQNARSNVGAIGIMQVMPDTGAELQVGDIRVAESNVHAGAKYMDQLMSRYFQNANLSELNRTLFAFASYNAGPGNIAKMRDGAVKRGLDPDQWFNNVEVVTAAKMGFQTTTYVRNIYKYYVAYRLRLDIEEAQERARKAVKQGE